MVEWEGAELGHDRKMPDGELSKVSPELGTGDADL